jgi:hypothetical protein
MRSILKHPEKVIVLEVAIGIVLSIVFIVVILNTDDKFWGKGIADGIIRFYLGMGAIFFVSVFTIGIMGAIISGQSKRIANAVIYAIGFWLLALVVTAACADFLPLLSPYCMLAGITIGFNIGLNKKPTSEADNSES